MATAASGGFRSDAKDQALWLRLAAISTLGEPLSVAPPSQCGLLCSSTGHA